jgi:hypothetical protein
MKGDELPPGYTCILYIILYYSELFMIETMGIYLTRQVSELLESHSTIEQISKSATCWKDNKDRCFGRFHSQLQDIVSALVSFGSLFAACINGLFMALNE